MFPPSRLPQSADDPLLPLFLAMSASPDTGTETLPDIDVDTDTEESSDLDQPWHVLIFNDPVNLMSYVTLIIRRVFGYPRETAERMMLDVHHKGQCVVWTGPREQAELYVQQLQGYQLLSAMKKAG